MCKANSLLPDLINLCTSSCVSADCVSFPHAVARSLVTIITEIIFAAVHPSFLFSLLCFFFFLLCATASGKAAVTTAALLQNLSGLMSHTFWLHTRGKRLWDVTWICSKWNIWMRHRFLTSLLGVWCAVKLKRYLFRDGRFLFCCFLSYNYSHSFDFPFWRSVELFTLLPSAQNTGFHKTHLIYFYPGSFQMVIHWD